MGNVIVCAVLAVIVTAIIFKMVKDKKNGKLSCGGNCAGCAGCSVKNAGVDVQTVLSIDGMMCGMCEAHINDAIRNNFDVKKVASSHKTGKTIILSQKPLDRADLKEVIEKTGYRLMEIE